jgi:hypothetical protein
MSTSIRDSTIFQNYYLNNRERLCIITKHSALLLSEGVRGSAVGWGNALQDGRSRFPFSITSLRVFIDLILLVALWPWGNLSPNKNKYPRRKGGQCVVLTTLRHSYEDFLRIRRASTSRSPRGLQYIELYMYSFTYEMTSFII